MKKVTTNSASSEVQSSKGSNKKGSALLILLIVLLVSVIGVLGATVYSLLTDENGNNTDSGDGSSGPKRDTVVTLENRDQILSDLSDKKVSDGLFEMKMNMEWNFEDAATPSENAYVANVTTNSNTIYFTVTLDSTGEKVYDSPYIPVGYALNNIALQADLKAGTYPCTLTYHLVDANEKDVSTVAVGVMLNVLK